MRFHSKFPWLLAFTGLVWIVPALLRSRTHIYHSTGLYEADLLIGVIWLFLTVWVLASYFFTYWDFNSDALYERRLWATRRIDYSTIAFVGAWGGKPSSPYLAIEFGKIGSALEPRTVLIANPSDRESFVRSLHEHAQYAEFSV